MGISVIIAPGTYLLLALMLFMLPINWVTGALGASLVHESSHLIMIMLTGGKVLSLKIKSLGAEIWTTELDRGQEAICALAGPIGSLLLAFVVKSMLPEMSLCAWMQGLFNLLPVYPLDGGRVMRCLISEAAAKAVQVMTLVLLWGMGIWVGMQLNLGVFPLFPAVLATRAAIPRKTPCKEPKLAVQ